MARRAAVMPVVSIFPVKAKLAIIVMVTRSQSNLARRKARGCEAEGFSGVRNAAEW
jgi:hypothetical protein